MRARRYWIGLMSGVGTAGWLLAQTVTSPMPPASGAAPIPPFPPPPKSRLEYFRELLAQTPAEREKALADKPAPQRKHLAAKITEYEALTPGEREVRLRVLELREYLLPLMTSAATNRLELLSRIPLDYRALVESRLQQWDILPPPLRQQILENDLMRNYFARWDSSSAEEQQRFLRSLPAAQREKLELEMARSRDLPSEQRATLSTRFNQFFELTETEKQKTLHMLPIEERRQTQQALQRVEKLPEDQRRRYLESLRKYSDLDPGQRRQFLINVERWKSMSPAERQNWRALVAKLPPVPPPMPPRATGYSTRPAPATNH